MVTFKKTHNRYEKYIPTNIDWIGDIPEGWEAMKLKFFASRIVDGTHFTPEYMDEGIPFLRVSDIQSSEIDFDSIKYISNEEHKILTDRCRPEKNDLLLSKNWTIWIPKVVDWDWTFSIFVSLCLIKLNRNVINPYFAKYSFEADSLRKQMIHGGQQTSVINLHLEKIKEFFFVIPRLDEQEKIIAYLDKKTALLDESIIKKQRQIELLSEHRTALINNAITKGLDSNVEMKKSWFEWVGVIPKGWEVRKMSHTLERCYAPIKTWPFGSDIKNEDIHEEWIYRIYNQRNVLDKNFEEPANYISERKFLDLKSCEIFPWDVLLTSRGTIWKTCLFPGWKMRGILHPCLIRIRTDRKYCSSEYLQLILENGKYIQEQFALLSNATTIEVIYGWTLYGLRLILPSIEEQEKIITYIRKETAYIDAMKAKIERSIELLGEYKTSLISHAVSWKIKVS